MATNGAKLTATQTDHHVKELKAEIQHLLPGAAKLVDTDKVGQDVCGDPGDTNPHAPTQYNYYNEVTGAHSKQFPKISEAIFKHFTESGWKVDEKRHGTHQLGNSFYEPVPAVNSNQPAR